MKNKVLFFYASWCNGCASMINKFYKEVKKNNIKFDVIDVEEKEGVDLSIKYGVKNVPTLVFLNGNNVIGVEKGNESYTKINKYC